MANILLTSLGESPATGRKGMTAMAIFAARNLGLPYVYHTLIADELNDIIEQDTTISALNNMTRTERNDRLFLRSYEHSQFHLFRVPEHSFP